MKRAAILCLLVMAMGCRAARESSQRRAAARRAGPAAAQQAAASAGSRGERRDPSHLSPTHNEGDIVVVLDVYTLTLPAGGISRNAEFWKKIDEDQVDAANHELMLKNGIRYGVGLDSEWESFFKPLLDRLGANAQRGSFDPKRAATAEFMMRQGVEYQDVFYLNPAGVLYGRTYQHCDNLFAMAFEAIADEPGKTRIRLCAVVRDQRFQFVVTELNQTQEIERRRPEYLYDLKLEAAVPIEHFLVVAPSELAELPSNVGSQFMIRPGNAGQVETVLVLVPKPFRLRAPNPLPAPRR